MTTAPGGTLTLAENLTISRLGYGAMQLAGPGVFGPPRDRDEAVAVLREAVDLGVTHIDTADFYGPTITNELIREALHPYPSGLHIATKVGARRGDDGSWIHSLDPEDLVAQVHDNLDHLRLDVLDVVYLRLETRTAHGGMTDDSIAEQFGALAELRAEGLIRHLALSCASDAQLTEAQGIAPVVAVQNLYNLAERDDDAMVERTARENIAYVAIFPLGGFSPLQSDTLNKVAADLGFSTQQVALAWLLQRSPTMTLIPGTSSRTHLRENVGAAEITLPADALRELDAIAAH
ncbi:oxidoreductase [Actinoallomurus sp. NBC_01490]|uniref:oxidoreductase n=1 Tax=Actinoallomurus sp. NBC_01490 TaxID=2903557 RepID=UPI002E37EC23|nr:oxidoreductase [Actinoallomurus sp. NBC_01490]